MALLDIRQRTGWLFMVVVVGHILLITTQVSTRRGIPFLEALTFGVFAEVQRGAALADPVGDEVGWFGTRNYDSDWEDRHVWTMAGFPFDRSMFAMSVEHGIAVRDDDDGDDIEVDGESWDTTQVESDADDSSGASGSPLFAWFGDLELVPHLWQMVCLGETEAVVTFFQPVDIDALGDRKKLAEHCFREVSRGVQAANTGRLELLPPQAGAPAATA